MPAALSSTTRDSSFVSTRWTVVRQNHRTFIDVILRSLGDLLAPTRSLLKITSMSASDLLSLSQISK